MRKLIVLLLLPIALFFVSGCVLNTATPIDALEDELVLRFPSVVVEYDRSGEATIFDVPVAQFSQHFPYVDLSQLSLGAEAVALLVENGVETIHIDNQSGGLRFFVNGESYPSIVWDEASRDGLINTLALWGYEDSRITGLVDLLPEVGMGAILKMPSADDDFATDYVIANLGVDEANAILTRARAPTELTVVLTYSEDGTASGKLPPLFTMFGLTLDALILPPELIASSQQLGVESFDIVSIGNGIFVRINGEELPYIIWEREELLRLVTLYDKLDGCVDGCSGHTMFMLLDMFQLPINLKLEFPSR